MQTILRPLAALLFFAAIAFAQIHAQLTSPPSSPTASHDTTEFINTMGLQGVIVYLTAKEWGPALMRKLRGNKTGVQNTDLDKADAVMEADIKNLIKNFDGHLKEDRENFKELRDSNMKIQEDIGEMKGMLRVIQQSRGR